MIDSASMSDYTGIMDVPADMRRYLQRMGREGGRIGGAKGGRARVRKGIACLSPERRREIAMLGVAARLRNRGKI